MEYFSSGSIKAFETPEYKMKRLKYVDPVTLNFKILLDFESTTGLLADEIHQNSALAYLKRVGEIDRYELLKKWIELFKHLYRDYEFLILEINGLEKVQNIRQWEFFNEMEDNIDITLRETSDLFVHSLITTYKSIWFDDNRKVEILPTNLRKFDMSIFVFSAGYYNMVLYDNNNEPYTNEKDIDRYIFPTINKLDVSDLRSANKKFESFNHVIYKFSGCSINLEETGKNFVSTMSNEPSSDYVKNNFSISYKHATNTGIFNNIFGAFNIGALLALSAIYSRNGVNNVYGINNPEDNTIRGQLNSLGNRLKQQKDGWKDAFKKSDNNLMSRSISNLKNSANTKLINQLQKLSSNSSPLGNLVSKMTPQFAEQVLSQAFNKGFTIFEDYAINNPLTKLNNLLMNNFSVYGNKSNPETFGSDLIPNDIVNGIKYGESN